MNINEYLKLLQHFDSILWGMKTSDTNWNYNALILDYYLDFSILSVDYLDIEDYFGTNGGFIYNETSLLSEQFKDLNEDMRIRLIENVLNIFKHSTFDKNVSEKVLAKVTRFLERNNIFVSNTDNGLLQLSKNDVVDEGSYCVIKKYKQGILKKEPKQSYRDDTKFQQRMKYEYENMQKLRDCPQVLNVYSYNAKEHSYIMEEADMNLFEYLNAEIDISFEQKLKIVYDVLYGMKYAHDHSIIHRDLHLGNILKIGNDFVLSDFGLSKDVSIVRSLKSSATEKNNHIFLDPLAIGDFTKLDKKSDIYSLGKVIEYVFTINTSDSENLFSYIVEKCTSRNKDKRYDTVDEILRDIEFKLKERDNRLSKQKVLEKLQNNVLDVQVIEFINNLVGSDSICDFLIKNKLYSFGNIIVQFERVDQIDILQAINRKYISSTGYGQFGNYDIFADIAHFVCLNTEDGTIYSVSYNILEGCAKYRFSAANNLLELAKQNV